MQPFLDFHLQVCLIPKSSISCLHSLVIFFLSDFVEGIATIEVLLVCRVLTRSFFILYDVNCQNTQHLTRYSCCTLQRLQLLSGLFYPRFSAAAGAVYSLGRLLYAIGYRAFGAKGMLCAVQSQVDSHAPHLSSFVCRC
jgi:hypothetical protein